MSDVSFSGAGSALTTVAAALASDGEPVDALTLAALPRDDLGNAARFVAREGRNVRSTQKLGVFVWDGARWALDDGGVRLRLKAQAVVRAIADEARALDLLAEQSPGDDELKDRAKAHWAWARTSANSARISALLTEALVQLDAPFETWNARADLVNCLNGTLDLGSAAPRLRPHRREDFLTRQLAVAYNPAATCDAFRAFVERILPPRSYTRANGETVSGSLEVRAFLQRALGAALVDSVSDQAMILLHGAGANGKSTLFDVVADVFGDYAASVNVKSFLADDRATGSSAAPDVVRLAHGQRLVRTSEPPPGARLAEGFVKEVTGGEPIVARGLHQDPLEFRPTWKVFIACNTRPSVRGGDDGIWRRLLLVPFEVQIPAAEQDPTLKARLQAEREGILNWLLEGWLDWYETRSLRPPEEVRAASDAYRAESDAVGRFLSEWTVRGTDADRTDFKKLYWAFEAWCKVEGVEPISQTMFGRRLSDRGFATCKSNGATFRTGLTLTGEAKGAVDDRVLEEARKSHRGRGVGAGDDSADQ